MYDVAHRATFDLLGEWLVEMRTHLPQPSNMDDVIVAVCANKVHVYTNSTCAYYAHNMYTGSLGSRPSPLRRFTNCAWAGHTENG